MTELPASYRALDTLDNRGHMRKALIGLAGVALVAACGGNSGTGPAASRNNPGTGSATLLVTADIDAVNVPGGFRTDYLVSLRDKLGATVSGATVTISNSTIGTLTLPEVAGTPGDYFNTQGTFPGGDFRLAVTRGTDNVQGVVLGGPSVHTMLAPQNGAVVPALQPLAVSWTVGSAAKAAILDTRNFGPISLPDNGSYTIAGANNPANANQRVRVKRYNEVDIAGGQPGSRLRVIVENTVEPLNVQ
ncbi:MAG: hypothetical protein NVS4B3_07920 [Gemmatimonadaceae bacterium]